MIRDSGRFLLASIASIAVVILLVVGVIYIVGTIKKETADFRGGVEQTETVRGSGAYRIAAYEQFFNLCASIQGQEATIAQMTDELNDPATTPERDAVLRASLTGVRSARNTNIAQYNGDAQKADTRANFLASNLPYHLEMNGETQCAV